MNTTQKIAKLVDDKTACEALGICIATLHNWKRKGKIPYYRIGGCIRYSIEEILDATRVEATQVKKVK